MQTAEAGYSRKKIYRGGGRGKPKPQWTLMLTIQHEAEKTVEKIGFRAATKYEATRKAFQRTQALLGGLLIEDWQNPRLQAELCRRNGGSVLGGLIFILHRHCQNYAGALKASGPQQMFREVIIGGGKTYH